MHSLRQRLVWVLTLIVFCASTADAHVTRVEILSRDVMKLAAQKTGACRDVCQCHSRPRRSAGTCHETLLHSLTECSPVVAILTSRSQEPRS